MVTIRGRVGFDFEEFEVSTQTCTGSEPGLGIWLEYGSGPKSQPTVWCCGDLKPVDPLRLVQDREFKRFHRFITARRKDCRGSGSLN
jgi:hypothetical protein